MMHSVSQQIITDLQHSTVHLLSQNYVIAVHCLYVYLSCDFFLAPPRNTPQLTKIEELYGESHVDFNCTGNPGYPDGELKFEVMLSNDTEFRPFQFYSSKVTNDDRKCVRSQLVNTTFLFNVEWNQAKIRCTNGPNYDETNIYIIPRKYIT